MPPTKTGLRRFLVMLALGLLMPLPLWAGASVVGLVAASTDTVSGGQILMPQTTLFSGDSLEVNEGVAIVLIDRASRVILGRRTSARFSREANQITVSLLRGNVLMYRGENSADLEVKAGPVSVRPSKDFKSLGEVAVAGDLLTATAREGSLRVSGMGSDLEVPTGKALTVSTKEARRQMPSTGTPASDSHTPLTKALQATTLAASGAAAGLSAVSMIKLGDANSLAHSALKNAQSALADSQTAAASATQAWAASCTTVRQVSPSNLPPVCP